MEAAQAVHQGIISGNLPLPVGSGNTSFPSTNHVCLETCPLTVGSSNKHILSFYKPYLSRNLLLPFGNSYKHILPSTNRL